MKNVIVNENDKGKRLDIYIAENFNELSRTMIKKLIESNNILVNDKSEKVSYKVQANDNISDNYDDELEADSMEDEDDEIFDVDDSDDEKIVDDFDEDEEDYIDEAIEAATTDEDTKLNEAFKTLSTLSPSCEENIKIYSNNLFEKKFNYSINDENKLYNYLIGCYKNEAINLINLIIEENKKNLSQEILRT